MKKSFYLSALVAAVGGLALGLTSTVANAATATATMAVSANVNSTCTISVSPLPFGNYTGTQVDTTTNLSVTCTNTTPYNVGLDAGATSGATVTTRQMTSGSKTLNYELFSDAGRTLNWGNTVGTDTVSGIGNGAGQNLTVYARIPSGQYVTPVAYTDTITATVNY